MAKRDRVTLTAGERGELERMVARGKADARKLAHARVLLQADEADGGPGWVDATIAAAVRVSVRTIERARQRFVEQGLSAALLPKPSPRLYGRKLDGEQEARLLALACAPPRPLGRKRGGGAGGPPAGAGLRPPARPRARRAGRCACWPSAWSSWSTWTGSPTRRSDRLSKKRAQAAPEEDVVHPAEAIGGVRLPHGGCARGLPPTSRPEIPGRVSGRDLHPADRRDARAAGT